LWLLLEAEFLALVLILVYVGAVMTLFLFVVMTLHKNAKFPPHMLRRYLFPALFVLCLLVVLVMHVLAAPVLHSTASVLHQVIPASSTDISNTSQLGNLLYTQYVYPFELAGILLLIAIVAAIALTGGSRIRNRRVQDVPTQINIKSVDCIRIVDMPTEHPRSFETNT